MKKNMKKIISWILVALWLYVIISFSNQTGGESGGISGKIVQIIIDIFNINNTESTFSTLQFFVRKLAHLTEYAILGILIFNALYNTINNLKLIVIISFVCCALYSIIDEINQLSVAGRVGSFKDCLIDSTGALLGVLFCLFIISLKKPKQRVYK